MFAECGLDSALFEDAEASIPYTTFGKILLRASAQKGCPHIGLLVGMSPPDMGVPGYLLLNAPTLREGFRDLVEALNQVDTGGLVRLDEVGDMGIAEYTLLSAGDGWAGHVYDTAIAVGYGLLRRACGPGFRALEIGFPRRRPPDLTLYRSYFSSQKLTFDAGEARISFARRWLDAPAQGADPALYRILKHLIGQIRPVRSPSLADKIRRVLPSLVRRGDAKADMVAKLFGLHPRTMGRRLTVERTTLHELISEARFEAACQLLQDTSLPLTTIAAHVHYSDASAFARAFRIRYAMTPTNYRKLQDRASKSPPLSEIV